ncbi:tetratricopeptide repeat protein [Marinobacterium sp. D7]|uniref:tetratricopeptide repeat protein n=1 Tax=Marinobacterium ramblicola TaxID=2849041 RepID=UPI001C2D179F|nr:tetratricopeptide repeat protein [Marinobacterium ramblicola]MBV1788906.1 tetratricopeptide repeat protein [Marinobacterium ramblicola]
MKKIALVLAAVLLAGCIGPNPYVTPVEDRSNRQPTTPPPPGSLESVEPSPGVSVQPIEDVPVFRPQREALPDSGSINVAPEPGDIPVSEPRNAAVVALLDSASQNTQGGDLRAAQSSLERALRIAPRDPQVYYQLADVQRRLGQFMQAEQVALKGVNVANGQPVELRRLWSLIALIRSDAGNSAGARAAQQEASRY